MASTRKFPHWFATSTGIVKSGIIFPVVCKIINGLEPKRKSWRLPASHDYGTFHSFSTEPRSRVVDATVPKVHDGTVFGEKEVSTLEVGTWVSMTKLCINAETTARLMSPDGTNRSHKIYFPSPTRIIRSFETPSA